MSRLEDLVSGCTVQGILPNELVTLVSSQWHGDSVVGITYKSASGRLGETLLYRDDESRLEISQKTKPWSFDAPGSTFRLVSEAYRIHLAALFDPLLAVHTSLVDPLPHQILAVYERMLIRQPLRFLLADDPGAGKTIMAGLLIKELMARGDLERCLVIAPGGLVEQWQDELDRKFQLPFEIATNDKLEAARTGNWFGEHDLAIARLDKLSRDEAVQERLKVTQWDMIIVDEAHKMSASFFGGEAKYTKRYHLGRLVSGTTRHFLLMTATPHNGKEEDFQLFMALLDGDRFEGRFRDGVHTADCSDIMRRLVKEQLLKFDGTPLFPERKAYTMAYALSGPEAQLYKDVTEYVREEFNRAEQLESDGRKGCIGFALTILQRRLASSPEAIYQSLQRRRKRLEIRQREARLLQRGGSSAFLETLKIRELEELNLDALQESDEATAEEVENAESEVLDKATAARTIEELEIEIEILKQLEASALRVRQSGVDKKWDELSKLLQDSPEMFDTSGNRRKIIIFTEHRDTLNYLTDRIGTLLGRPESIVNIMGGMGRDQRRNAEESFRHDPDIQILVATDAASEGLNLQRAHLMVNYDLPWNPNRLEQRFGRIHRIGQTEVCHLWNLIAHETREGEVYRRLLEKLEIQRKALGGRDSVFDVLGRLFAGQSLRELLIQAIRYGEQPEVKARLEQAIDNATDREHIRKLLDEEALARDSMDSRRVQLLREDMERAEAKRLQPHFIEAFFMAAFKEFGGRIVAREQGRFEITRVPATIRNRDRQIGRGAPVLARYERVTFEKSLIYVAGQPVAAFICPGHPLLDSVIDLVLEQHRNLLRNGTVLIDPYDSSESPRALFYLEHTIHDAVQLASGDHRVISREMQFVEISADQEIHSAGSAPYLDYRPATEEELDQVAGELEKGWLGNNLEQHVLSYAAQQIVPDHLALVRKNRDELIEKCSQAIRQRLTKEITYWDHRAQELKAREEAGKTPRINSTMARQRADDLEARLKNRLSRLDCEKQLSPSPPIVIGGAMIIPQGLLDRINNIPEEDRSLSVEERARIDRKAVEAVVAAEFLLGRKPKVMSHDNKGYDIESIDPNEPGRLRFIEVKGKAVGKKTVTVSSTQIRYCCNQPDNWILAVVQVDGDQATEPCYLYGPFLQPPEFAEVGRNFSLADLLSRSGGPS
ncbi:helicase-related protein [Planctomycetota bacterium]